MSSYCLKCRKDTEIISPKIPKTNNDTTIILPKYAICGHEKSRFITKQDASGILSNLGLKAPSNKIPLLGVSSFKMQLHWMHL